MPSVEFERLPSSQAKARFEELVGQDERIHVFVVEQETATVSTRTRKARTVSPELERLAKEDPIEPQAWETFFDSLNGKASNA